MALVWAEGGEALRGAIDGDLSVLLTQIYTTPLQVGSALVTLQQGRHFGFSIGMAGNATNRTFAILLPSAQATVVTGAALMSNLSGTHSFLEFFDGATRHVHVVVNTDGSVQCSRNGTLVGSASAAGVIKEGKWHYIEFKATIADSPGGSFEIRVDGTNVASGSSLDTRNGGNASADRVAVRGGPSNHLIRVDDWYVCDTTGSVNNDFLGDIDVESIFPVADITSDFTPSTGTDNYAMVDRFSSDGDTAYNESNTTGHVDLYTFSDLEYLDSEIKGIIVLAVLRQTATTNDVELLVDGSAFANKTITSSTYTAYYNLAESDFATSVAWTADGINGVEAGVEIK